LLVPALLRRRGRGLLPGMVGGALPALLRLRLRLRLRTVPSLGRRLRLVPSLRGRLAAGPALRGRLLALPHGSGGLLPVLLRPALPGRTALLPALLGGRWCRRHRPRAPSPRVRTTRTVLDRCWCRCDRPPRADYRHAPTP